MRPRSLRRPVFILAVVALAAGAGFWAYRRQLAERPQAEASPGVVRETEIRIAPETQGRLASVRVVAGQRVRKGDILAILSSPEVSAAVEEAKASAADARADRANVYAGVRAEEVDIAARDVDIAASNLALAQEQYDRAAALAAKNFQTGQKLDEAGDALRKAQASLALQRAIYDRDKAGPTVEERASADAKVQLADAAAANLAAKLAKTTLVAPVDGRVSLLVAAPGEVISPGQSIMTLEAGRERWFTFTIREDHLGAIGIGSPLSLRNAKGERIDARVTELRPLGEFAVWRAARAVGDHDLNSFLVRADPVAETEGLEPGMTVWLDRANGVDGVKR
jgi:multidrug resistance efflux pump